MFTNIITVTGVDWVFEVIKSFFQKYAINQYPFNEMNIAATCMFLESKLTPEYSF